MLTPESKLKILSYCAEFLVGAAITALMPKEWSWFKKLSVFLILGVPFVLLLVWFRNA